MNLQEQEARDYDNAHYDRFAGFDRGDLDRDHDADQLAQNETFWTEFLAELASNV